MKEQQLRSIEARLAAAESATGDLLRVIERLKAEIECVAFTEAPADYSPRQVIEQGSRPEVAASRPQGSRRALGEPEFSRIPDHPWISRRPDITMMAVFLLVICLPFAAYLAHWESGESLNENRNLAAAPRFGKDSLATLPAKIDAYYRDYFGFRKRLIHLADTIRHKWLRASSESVVIGKDKWVFYAKEQLIEDYVGVAPFKAQELEAWRQYLEARRSRLEQRGIRYLFIVAPDKTGIYPEMLPDHIRSKAGRCRLDQLLDHLRSRRSPVEILDLRQAMLSSKSHGLLYFPQDTHWNGRGYFVAYKTICDYIRRWFPEVQSQQLGAVYSLQATSWSGGEWAVLGLPEENARFPSEFLFATGAQRARRVPATLPPAIPHIVEPWNAPLKTVHPNAKHKLLMTHDSFMRTGISDIGQDDGALLPFSEHFGESLYLGARLNDLQLLELAGQERPDLVLEERVQRYVVGSPPVVPYSPHIDGPAASECYLPPETILGAGVPTLPRATNATLRASRTGLEVIATTNDPVLHLPKPRGEVARVSIRMSADQKTGLELYVITRDPEWARRPLRAALLPGANRISFDIGEEDVLELRLDPASNPGRFLIEELTYQRRCR